MNVLVYGTGAREHAICLKLLQSKLLSKLYLACPNDGFKDLGEEIKHNSYEELAFKAKQKNIELAIIGPEQPLMDGLADVFINKEIKVIGATSIWAKLESSKSFAKDFMIKHNIKTAEYITIKSKEEACTAIDIIGIPIVIKADGLCAGKGVKIAYSKDEAIKNIDAYLKGKFGEASKKIIL